MHSTLNEAALNAQNSHVSFREPTTKSDQTKRFDRLAQHDDSLGELEQSKTIRLMKNIFLVESVHKTLL